MPPRLLTLTTPTVRNQRTLIWLRQQDPNIKWNKWESVVSSFEDYHRWDDLDARIVGMVLVNVPNDIQSFVDELYEISKDVQVVLISHEILSLKTEEFWAENFDNLICLDTALDSYPFLTLPWDGTLNDGIAIMAHLCRYHRLVDTTLSSARLDSIQPIQAVLNIVPQETWLITQFFRHQNPTRHSEILTCLERNIECSYIDRIILLNEKDLSKDWNAIPGSNKVSQIIIKKRLTYANFLQFVHDEVPANVFTILSNADIYFGRSLHDLYDFDMTGRTMALLRWDDQGTGPDEAAIFGPRADSQDAWIFLSDTIRDSTWPYTTFDFPLGQPGCDNAFAAHLLRNHIVLSNPALSFKTYHLHNSDVRNYSKKDTIRSDLYINLVPTYIIDTKQEQVPIGSPACICNQLVSFEVKSSSLSNEISYCTMLEKEGRYKWEATVENNYFEPAIPVYRWEKSCVTTNGLVYDPYTIYVGKHIEEFPYWRGAKVDIFTPLYKRDQMLAIPFADSSIFQHPDTYVLQYVSRAARLLQDYPNASFWMPTGMDFALDWNVDVSQVVEWKEPTACWADEVIGFVPGPHALELGHEDIQVLRKMLPSWKRGPIGQICVVVVDSTITNRFVLERITAFLQKEDPDWVVQIISDRNPGSYDSIVGASLCIVLGGPQTHTKWARLWALPTDACVVEFQQELTVDGELQHLCHVSDFKSWVLLLAKGSVSDVQDQIMEQFEKWYKKNQTELSLTC
jgi:hypothetical protein